MDTARGDYCSLKNSEQIPQIKSQNFLPQDGE